MSPARFTRVHLSGSIKSGIDVCESGGNGHVTLYHGIRGKQSSRNPVEVGEGELDAGVGETQLVDVGGRVPRTNVALAAER